MKSLISIGMFALLFQSQVSLADQQAETAQFPLEEFQVISNFGGSVFPRRYHYAGDTTTDKEPIVSMRLILASQWGKRVFSSRSGRVVEMQRLTWKLYRVVIKDEHGFKWEYWPLHHGTIPFEVYQSFREGTWLEQGTRIGRVGGIDVLPGKYSREFFFRIVSPDGEYLNPVRFFPELLDDEPNVGKIVIFLNQGSFLQALKRDRGNQLLSKTRTGSYRLYLEVECANPQVYSVDISINGRGFERVHTFDWVYSTVNYEGVYIPVKNGKKCEQTYICPLAIDRGQKLPTDIGRHRVEVEVRNFAGDVTEVSFEYLII